MMDTVKSEAVAGVHFGVDTEEVGEIRGLYEASIEELLSGIVELIGPDSALEAEGVISGFANDSVNNFGPPPDSWVRRGIPFL